MPMTGSSNLSLSCPRRKCSVFLPKPYPALAASYKGGQRRMKAVVTVEHAIDHLEQFTVPEFELKDHSVGQPIIDAVDYVFDEKFALVDSEREDFHEKTYVRFES